MNTIPRMFFEVAEENPDLAAVIEDEAGKSWSYGDLATAVQQAGRSILDLGLVAGDKVSIWAPNRVEWIIAALGVQSAGGVLVPLNTRFKGKEAGFVLESSQAKFLFCADSFLEIDYLDLLHKEYGEREYGEQEYGGQEGSQPIVGISALKHIIKFGASSTNSILGWEDFLALGESEEHQAELEKRIAATSPDDLSDILFTSGTTGLPKGVMTTHNQSLKGYKSWAQNVGLKKGDKYLIINPFFHAFGYKAGWLASFMMAATIYPKSVFDPGDAMATIQEHKISFLPGPPTIFQSILNHSDFGKYDLSSLKVAVTGAAAIPVELIVDMRKKLQFESVFTAYGLTESSGLATMCVKGDAPEIIATTSGKPMKDVEVIVADEAGKKVPPGESGEVLIRGYNVTQGYLDDPQATDDAIDENGWLHTGDIGIMNEQGYLKITDRKKDMFIMGGFNAYPAEIENLMMSHPSISQVAVIGIPDEKFGEVGAAFVITKTGSKNLEAEELLQWCKENMANYKVPRKIEFVDELPMNASGKVLKYELRKNL